jgi:hypothetical protein
MLEAIGGLIIIAIFAGFYALLNYLFGRGKCGICGVPLEGKTYYETIHGRICSKCHGKIDSRNRKAAFKRKFGF